MLNTNLAFLSLSLSLTASYLSCGTCRRIIISITRRRSSCISGSPSITASSSRHAVLNCRAAVAAGPVHSIVIWTSSTSRRRCRSRRSTVSEIAQWEHTSLFTVVFSSSLFFPSLSFYFFFVSYYQCIDVVCACVCLCVYACNN